VGERLEQRILEVQEAADLVLQFLKEKGKNVIQNLN
jgi:hypothetical protein